MKAAYVILIVVVLALVVWDIITPTLDVYTYVGFGVLVALVIALVVLEKREQQS